MDDRKPVLPYWQVNVSVAQRTPECPEYLQNQSAKNISILSTPDSSYHIATWPETQRYVADNRLDLFQRIPSQLRLYLAFIWKLEQEHRSVMQFILEKRLGWSEPVESEGMPFENDSNWKILWNDWPYGIDDRIAHLVVWTKFELEDDPATDDLTEKGRREIDEFVEKTFRRRVGSENVIWFKNWRSLKSVHAVEHFHVMLYDPDPEFVKEITNGDTPLGLQFKGI
ncbi:hypothetical protein B7494_g3661 [Chlorociboria aeruginascens]|nr:hypothetical protein B7494_g3661 [Chlorociboria aeruginascens]